LEELVGGALAASPAFEDMPRAPDDLAAIP
jgi:hypothetical protein